jgi:hypothetical protein
MDYDAHVEKNALRALRLPNEYTLAMLKNNFKRLALIHHPDKGGEPREFEYISDCYKHLFKRLHNHSPSFEDMRKHAQGRPAEREQAPIDKADFHTRFNTFYEKHHLPDENIVRGYDEFISEHEVKVNGAQKFKISKYRPPSPQHLSGKLNFVELGTETHDFSGKNDNRHKLFYTDYREAHTTDKLVEQKYALPRQEWKTMEELQTSREKESFELSSSDQKRYDLEQERFDKNERRRRQRLLDQDTARFKYFDSVNANYLLAKS